MLIAVLSDSHSDYANIELALERLRGSGVEHVLHCGDIADSMAVEMFSEFPTSFVFGNVDSDLAGLRRAMERSGNRCCGKVGEVELAGRKIAFTHGDDHRTLRSLEQSGLHDMVCYGHTHVAEQHQVGATLVLNPGALHRARTKTIAIVDLSTMRAETVAIAGM